MPPIRNTLDWLRFLRKKHRISPDSLVVRGGRYVAPRTAAKVTAVPPPPKPTEEQEVRTTGL